LPIWFDKRLSLERESGFEYHDVLFVSHLDGENPMVAVWWCVVGYIAQCANRFVPNQLHVVDFDAFVVADELITVIDIEVEATHCQPPLVMHLTVRDRAALQVPVLPPSARVAP
jgi:hypothetical protein